MTKPPLFLPAEWLWHLKQRESSKATAFSAWALSAASRGLTAAASRQKADRVNGRKGIGGPSI